MKELPKKDNGINWNYTSSWTNNNVDNLADYTKTYPLDNPPSREEVEKFKQHQELDGKIHSSTVTLENIYGKRKKYVTLSEPLPSISSQWFEGEQTRTNITIERDENYTDFNHRDYESNGNFSVARYGNIVRVYGKGKRSGVVNNTWSLKVTLNNKVHFIKINHYPNGDINNTAHGTVSATYPHQMTDEEISAMLHAINKDIRGQWLDTNETCP